MKYRLERLEFMSEFFVDQCIQLRRIGFTTMFLAPYSIVILVKLQVFIHSGLSLECYYCSGKTSADCRDPFPEDSNSTRLLNCSTLRSRSLNVLNVYRSLLHNVTSFKPLGPEPHVCYKRYDGDYPMRGCAQSDFCFNYTTTICELCDQDGCNSAQTIYHSHNTVLLVAVIYLLT